MSDFSSRLANLSPAKLELLARLTSPSRVNARREPLSARARSSRAPMSSAQERLWFLHQLAPASAVYNAPVAIRMVGTLNLRAIEQSLTEIVRRHEILRTTF